MKASRVLIASILLNLGLLLAAAILLHQRRPAASQAPQAPELGQTAPAETTAPRLSPRVVTVTSSSSFSWSQVESDDYRTYILNLRAMACPEETIRDILIADVKKLFAPKLQTLMTSRREDRFWEPPVPGLAASEQELSRQVSALVHERTLLIQELLGVTPREGGTLSALDSLRSKLSFLPEEKREKALQALALSQEEAGASEDNDPSVMDEDQEMGDPGGLQEEALAAVLSPEELAEYAVRHSELADDLRRELDGFSSTEKEFREIFKYRQLSDAAIESDDPSGKARSQQELETAKTALRQTLGEERFAEFQRQQEPDYRQLLALSGEQGLPRDTAAKAFDLMQASRDAARKIRVDQNLTSDQRQQALHAVAAEADRAMAESLGAASFKAYKERGNSILNLPRSGDFGGDSP